MTPTTSFQTIGPYWHLIEESGWDDLTRFGAVGERITLTGRVTDGEGAAVADACVEIWQASPDASESFPAWGRCRTDATGRFAFTTLRPGPVPGLGNATQAPHIALTLLARGILTRLCTRAYFEDEPLNKTDPLLGMIADPARRQTLIARTYAPGTWQMDIRLQGALETVFLDI